MLQELGLDAISEHVYRVLLEEPTLQETALAQSLNVAQAQIDTALERLTDLAVLRTSRDDPSKRYPVSLERCVALLRRRQESELEARRKALLDGEASAAVVVESSARRRFQNPTAFQHVTTLDDIQNLVESLTQSARTEVCSMVPNVMPEESLEAARDGDDEILRRKVKFRALCHDKIRSNAAAMAYEQRLLAQGAQIRTSTVVPMRVLIVDQANAVIPYNPDSREEGAILTVVPGIVRSLYELFERCWDDAKPLEATPRFDDATGLTKSETKLLTILSNGLTDEVAARRLGVSVRTVRRRMEDLMRRLDAGSRFEAGYNAAKRGWL
ncbi:sugar-specific transcriptional regulator TrmB/DNA-binding CsgD family transcriptional regulator [Catenulispora sp. GAS73]